MKTTLLILPFFLTTFLFGQQKIKGRVPDSLTNQAIEGVYFYVKKDHDKQADIDSSDKDGYFTV